MRRLIASLCLAAAACLGSGCFVLDEIDKGQELMDKHSPRAAQAEEAAEPEDDSGGLVARVKDWWAGLGEGGETESPADSGPPPHPDDVLGTCDLGRSLTFMRKFDCLRHGGTFQPRKG